MILSRSENPRGTRICRPSCQSLFNFFCTSDTLLAQLVTFGLKERNRGPGLSVGKSKHSTPLSLCARKNPSSCQW
jgi:hypothetical protein